MHTKLWQENLNGRENLDDLEARGKIILKWILEKQNGKLWTGFI
jgi:hypothetical protein